MLFNPYNIHMKSKIIIGLVFIFYTTIQNVYSQQKVKKYCELFVQYTSGPNIRVRIDAGVTKLNLQFRDSTVIVRLKRAERFETLSGALNYLNEIGWNYEASIPSPETGGQIVRLVLSKEFERSEIIAQSGQ